MKKILTYTVQVTVPDDTDRDTVTGELTNAIRHSAGWPRWIREYGWDVGPVIPQGGEVTVPGDPSKLGSTPDGVSLDSSQKRYYWPGRPWGNACGLCDTGIPHTPGDCGKYAR